MRTPHGTSELIARNDLDIADSAGTTSPASSLHGTTLDIADSADFVFFFSGDAEPGRGSFGDQHLERQVPVQLLARLSGILRSAETATPATSPDVTWTPLITAPYPDHVSGHLGLDGAHTGVLRMFFGDAPAGGYSDQKQRRESRRAWPRVRSAASIRRSTRSSRPASAASTSAPRTCRPGSSERTSRTSQPRNTFRGPGQPLTRKRRRLCGPTEKARSGGLLTFAARGLHHPALAEPWRRVDCFALAGELHQSAQKSRSDKSLFPVDPRTIRNESGTSTSSLGSPGSVVVDVEGEPGLAGGP